MAKMTNDELASKLSNEIDSATGNFNTELSEQREQSMKYYLGEPFGNEIEGRSEIVTTDVRDTIEYIMPSLMRIFTTHNNVAEFVQEPGAVTKAKCLLMRNWYRRARYRELPLPRSCSFWGRCDGADVDTGYRMI